MSLGVPRGNPKVFDREYLVTSTPEIPALLDLIAFGRSFTANPDLVDKLRTNGRFALPDPKTIYSGGAKGYIDAVALKG
ncbi:MAG TPA: hypothetical protein VJY33_26530 [Isosphaeraceae bacterium]|nr:hypothetical protein [Isosphaeraceae bacterium]